MKLTLSTLLMSLTLSAPAWAQQKADDHPAVSATAPAADDMTDAEVRKVDKGAGKLTLRHGEIRNLDMPPMTMVFAVRDKALLETLKTGDKVRFKAVNDGGMLTVTEIRLAQ